MIATMTNSLIRVFFPEIIDQFIMCLPVFQEQTKIDTVGETCVIRSQYDPL